MVFVSKSILSKYCDPCFLVIFTCMNYLSSSLRFQSMCVLCPKVGLLQTAYCRLLVFCLFVCLFFIKSATLCLLIRAFSPLIFKVIFTILFLFIWLHQTLVVAHCIFSCSRQGLFAWPGIEPGSPELGTESQPLDHQRSPRGNY